MPTQTLASCAEALKAQTAGRGKAVTSATPVDILVIVLQVPATTMKATKHGDTAYCSVLVGDSTQLYRSLACWRGVAQRGAQLRVGEVILCSGVRASSWGGNLSFNTSYNTTFTVVSRRDAKAGGGYPMPSPDLLARHRLDRAVVASLLAWASDHFGRGVSSLIEKTKKDVPPVTVTAARQLRECNRDGAPVNLTAAVCSSHADTSGSLEVVLALQTATNEIVHVVLNVASTYTTKTALETGRVYKFCRLGVVHSTVRDELILQTTFETTVEAADRPALAGELFWQPASLAQLNEKIRVAPTAMVRARVQSLTMQSRRRTYRFDAHQLMCTPLAATAAPTGPEAKRRKTTTDVALEYEGPDSDLGGGGTDLRFVADFVYLGCPRCNCEPHVDHHGVARPCCGSDFVWMYRPFRLMLTDASLGGAAVEVSVCHSAALSLFLNISPDLLVEELQSRRRSLEEQLEEDSSPMSWCQTWLELCRAAVDPRNSPSAAYLRCRVQVDDNGALRHRSLGLISWSVD